MVFFDLAAFEATPLVREPFAFVVVPHFIQPALFEAIAAEFPKVPGPGSFPLPALDVRGAFQGLVDELNTADFQHAIERKFAINLENRPKTLTIRGEARHKDGAVHTDTGTKLISVLLYMNDEWTAPGGCLRLLRSQNLDDLAVEVPPVKGTLVAFQRSSRSWHGHHPYVGPRCVIQLNWMTKKDAALWQQGRHLASAYIKRLSRLFLD